nr:hypothetical protein [uncultured Thiodictyon sp.]
MDEDGDGLSTTDEIAYGTNPRNPDSDADGMPDGWEVAHGLDPLLDDARGDMDHDGARNLLEYQCGTDPAKQRDIPMLLLPNRSGWRAILP